MTMMRKISERMGRNIIIMGVIIRLKQNNKYQTQEEVDSKFEGNPPDIVKTEH